MGKHKTKWGHLVGKLPKLLTEDAKRQQKIETLKGIILEEYREEHGGMPPGASWLLEEYLELRTKKDQLEKELEEVELQLNTFEQMLEAQYEAEGVSMMRLSDGDGLTSYPEPYAVVEDRTKFRKWAVQNGLEDSLVLPWQTTNKLLKDALESGQPEPDGIKAFLVTKFKKL